MEQKIRLPEIRPCSTKTKCALRNFLSPRIRWKIDYDWFGRASDDDPAEGRVLRAVYFTVHEPRGDMQKISAARDERMFAAFAPLNVRFAGKHIGYGFLRAVMMDACLRAGFYKKSSAP